MKATNSLKVKSVLAIFLVAAQLVIVSADALAAPAMDTAPALPEGIGFIGQLSQDDVTYFQNGLQLLHERLPEWYEYVMESRPFTLTFDPAMDGLGRAAVSACCDAQGYGLVTVGQHFGQLTIPDDPDSETVKARQVTFLGLIVHELTHVRDQRAGRFTTKTDRKSCVAAESSGLTKQLDVKRDLAAQLASDPTSDQSLTRWLYRQVETEASDLHSRELWDLYCGAFEN